MDDLDEGYAPGFAADAVSMMASRTAATRAAFLLPHLRAGWHVLDVGCGPGTITTGLAEAVSPNGSCVGLDLEPSQIELARASSGDTPTFVVGSAYALPFAAESFDAVFSHALFEHLAHPRSAAAELRRVLRPGGVAGVCCSDWGDASIEPLTPDVELAVACHLELRREAGGDPYAGASLAGVIEAAGLELEDVRTRHEVDMTYGAYARYIGTRLSAAAALAAGREQSRLRAGAAAAGRWAVSGDGRITQPWTSVVARRT